jgi:O-antigen/teichoic acid export membrane protein
VIAFASPVMIALASGATAWLLADQFSRLQLTTFAWGLVLVPMLVMVRVRDAAIRGLRHVVAGQLCEAILRPALLLTLVITFALVAIDLTADRAMALHVFAAAVASLMSVTLLSKFRPAETHFVSPRFEHGAWLRSMLPLGLTAGMMLITRQSDIVVLGLFVEADQVGIYRVAVQASMLVAFGLQAVNMVAMPHVTRLYNRGAYPQLQYLATACARASLAIALPAAVTFSFFGEALLRWIVGVDYVTGAFALAILACGQVVNAGMGSVGLLLNMTDNEMVVTRILAFSVAGNIVANLALIPLWGMNGAAWATAMTFILWNVLLSRAVKKRLGINSTVFARRATS